MIVYLRFCMQIPGVLHQSTLQLHSMRAHKGRRSTERSLQLCFVELSLQQMRCLLDHKCLCLLAFVELSLQQMRCLLRPQMLMPSLVFYLEVAVPSQLAVYSNVDRFGRMFIDHV